MGPTATMTHILQKLVSFDILMQNFYKVTQGNHEKVPAFAMRLEGTLNQIRLQCPRRMMDLEVQQHLKDHLFQGICKHIRDSIRYLYSTPGTSYLQLMVAAHKAESKNQEIWDKVRARAAVATDCREGTTELGQHFAKLMAALTKVGQGHSPASAQAAPGREAMEGDAPTGVLLATPVPIMARPVFDRPPWTTAHYWLWDRGYCR